MKRFLFLIAAVLLPAAVCFADDDDAAAKVKFPARETYREFYQEWNDLENDKEHGVPGQHIKITVSPATLPYPLLKYRFNTYVTELESGNAAPLYSEAYARFRNIEHDALRWKVYETEEFAKAKYPKLFKNENAEKQSEEKDDNPIGHIKFQAFPLKPQWDRNDWTTITAEQEDELFKKLDEVYRLIEKASKKRDCDWSYQMEYQGLATLLPHVQNMRVLARYLQGKAEWEIRNGKYDDAVKTIRLGLRMAEHLETSDAPFIITQLMAIAEKEMMLGVIRLLSTQPDSPNLYPALTQIVFHNDSYLKSLQTEEYMWFSRNPQHVQELVEKMDANSPEECKELLKDLMTALHLGLNSDFDLDSWMTTACLACYPYGKERLLKRGLTEKEIEKLSVYQVVTPFILEEIRAAYDKIIVFASFPIDSKHTAIEFNKNDGYPPFANSPVDVYLALLMPAVTAAKQAFLRTEQSLDLLKITEAIRYYAAINDGKLPESLEQIDQLYINPIGATNNKPFDYHVEGNTAIIDYNIYIYGGGKSRLEITVK